MTPETGTTVTPETSESISFFDVQSSDWFYKAVTYVSEKGLMNGTGSGNFDPMADTTRGMIVTVLHSLAGYPTPSSHPNFSDVSTNDWYANAVSWAYEVGVASGMGDNTFEPNGYMTREQLVVMLYGYAKAICGESSTDDLYLAFEDNDSISFWAEEAVAWAVSQGLVSGRPDGSFGPQATANRAEVAVILKNFSQLYG